MYTLFFGNCSSLNANQRKTDVPKLAVFNRPVLHEVFVRVTYNNSITGTFDLVALTEQSNHITVLEHASIEIFCRSSFPVMWFDGNMMVDESYF